MDIVRRHLICGVHFDRYPKGRPIKVGEAWTNGAGRWVSFPVRRNSARQRHDDRERGLGPRDFLIVDPRFVDMDGSGSAEDRRPVMERLLSNPLRPGEVDDYLICAYQCREKHWDGAPDQNVGAHTREELVRWLDLALDEGLRQVPLPTVWRVPVAI